MFLNSTSPMTGLRMHGERIHDHGLRLPRSCYSLYLSHLSKVTRSRNSSFPRAFTRVLLLPLPLLEISEKLSSIFILETFRPLYTNSRCTITTYDHRLLPKTGHPSGSLFTAYESISPKAVERLAKQRRILPTIFSPLLSFINDANFE